MITADDQPVAQPCRFYPEDWTHVTSAKQGRKLALLCRTECSMLKRCQREAELAEADMYGKVRLAGVWGGRLYSMAYE